MMKNDVVRGTRGWALGLAVALAIFHPACGSDNNGNGGSETFSESETLSVLEPFGVTFTSRTNGNADASVNWNDNDNDIDVFVTRGSCFDFDDLLNDECDVIASSESSSRKPETVSFNISNGTAYTVWAWNIGPDTDTVTIRVTVD